MAEQEIIDLTKKLLDSIVRKDFKEYEEICAKDLTSFEPEGQGHLIKGLPFHKFYFDLESSSPYNGKQHIFSPVVRFIGETGAVIAYNRVIQVGVFR